MYVSQLSWPQKKKKKNTRLSLLRTHIPYHSTVILSCCFDYENGNLLTTTFKVIKYCSKNKQKKMLNIRRSTSDTHQLMSFQRARQRHLKHFSISAPSSSGNGFHVQQRPQQKSPSDSAHD